MLQSDFLCYVKTTSVLLVIVHLMRFGKLFESMLDFKASTMFSFQYWCAVLWLKQILYSSLMLHSLKTAFISFYNAVYVLEAL